MHEAQLLAHQAIDGVLPPLARDRSELNRRSSLLSVITDLSQAERVWRSFEQRADCTPFQTFDWLDAWQRCIGAPTQVKPAIVVGRQANGGVLFILPLAIEPFSFCRRLVFLGHELCDYNGPLLAPEFSERLTPSEFNECWRSIQLLLQRTPGCGHDLIFLDKMPERIGGQRNPLLVLETTPNPSSAYRTRLDDNWDDFYSRKRSPERRRRDRARRKKLAAIADLGFATPERTRDVQATLDVLFEQKSAWFARTGVPDLFARPGYPEFFKTVASKPDRLVRVTRLDVGPDCIAASLSLTFRGCYYQLLISYDERLARLGPGTAHLHSMMQYAIELGCTHYDFTIGDESFKLDWADERLDLFDHVAYRTASGRLIATVIRLALALKRYIKSSQLLWPMATRVRRLPGAIKSAARRRQRAD